MLKLKFTPQRNDEGQLIVNWNDPVLTVQEVQYDLSELPDGATAEHEVLRQVIRNGNDYEVLLVLPHGSNASEATRFPQDLEIFENGIINVPLYNEVI